MRHSYRPDIPPKPQPYRTLVLDHLGLVAGMFEELGITEVIDKATQQDPEMRIVTAGHAVKAMVLNGLGFVNQQLYLVPHFFHNKPLPRLIAPGIEASHLNDDSLGRALDTLYETGLTDLYSLIAATAAQRLGLAPHFAHLGQYQFSYRWALQQCRDAGGAHRAYHPWLQSGSSARPEPSDAGVDGGAPSRDSGPDEAAQWP